MGGVVGVDGFMGGGGDFVVVVVVFIVVGVVDLYRL